MHSPVLLAVDGNSLLHRAFHAHSGIGAPGESVWAVRGLLTQLVAAVERVGADAVVVGFDDPKVSLRRKRWPEYKANRVDKPEVLVSQLLLAASVLGELGICVVTPAGLEADDVLCSAAAQAASAGMHTVIMTSDRDSFALISDTTRVLRIINGGVDASPLLTAERLWTMIGVRPEQYRDYAALRGDPSDNLPGVPGIGPKTASRLLAGLGSAEAAFADADAGGAEVAAAVGKTVAARLAEPQSRQRWERNCAVMHMHSDVQLGSLQWASTGASDPAEQGRMPVPADCVRSIFTEHRLLATLPTALRVLAHVDGPSGGAPSANGPSASDPVATGPVASGPSARTAEPSYEQFPTRARHPRLPRPQAAKVDQLALF